MSKPPPNGTKPLHSLSQRVAEHLARRGAASPSTTRAQVVLMRAEIRAALDDGFSMLHIWEVMREEGRVAFGYHTFRRHVLAVLQTSTPQASTKEAKPLPRQLPAPQATAQSGPAPAGPRSTPASMPGFVFDPIPNPEELY